ncbi:probable disease resistance protein At4g27220 isoform X2 [Prosopis cineraria]|uniref:probable disease resistance protein At4g27220 isoform X2 n=1 Tax=Prosopis cineraria TaxID=364024 RepID=UPI00240F72F8|nr:probable disease resistance protein At4g27220 isoform X2 [Prosopis cineraria]XP_054792832.1 probable disease resistance protein At4g27220 isoform X2 [Prosopis cineraria]XP_054792839.1 probable disease resistance protein At4g27220 isoform X2 [Prosopis cineraria]XP_054792846.1 probable disease resistance protein At4g27220 isoform X2 [Prosopis cineraria]
MNMEFVTLIIKELSSSLQEKAKEHLKQILEEQFVSFFQYEYEAEKLKNSIQVLRGRKETVQRRIEDEIRHGKDIAENVSKWLEEVEDLLTKNDEFLNDKDRLRAVCSFKEGILTLPKPGIRHRLGRTAYSLARKVDNTLTKASFSDGLTSGLRPIAIDFIFLEVDFESFDSRNVVTDKITKVLRDSTNSMIGIYGLGGIGKTTLVWKAVRDARDDSLFDVVVFASVTRNPDIRKIQGQLADQLGTRLDDETEIGRASRLRYIFKMEKRNTLVILDDLWAELDLNMLGIPVDDIIPRSNSTKDNFKKTNSIAGNRVMNEQTANKSVSDKATSGSGVPKKKEVVKMFKVLLTSRSKKVLSDKMDVKENSNFLIEGLQDEEAEKLLRKVARVANKSLKFGPLATKISNKCGGLPIAVVTIGRTLRNKNYLEWKDTLGQLERKEFTEVAESVEFSTKLSFHHLENEKLKSTFLLCAQLGHHPQIMDLVKYYIGLGIFEMFLTIKEARARVFKLIEKLKDSSLLLNSYSIDRFNMHDMILEVALSISSKERHSFTMQKGELHEWPHKNEFKMHSAISIQNYHIKDKLPDSIRMKYQEFWHYR